uniref:AP2/ERF domain-containing protein n=1 Tax=Glycine max TaxID=3847 RepID=K7MQ22_SOYBN
MSVQPPLNLHHPFNPQASSSNFDGDPPCKTAAKTKPPRKKLLRVILTDHDATDSDSSGDDDDPKNPPKHKKEAPTPAPIPTPSSSSSIDPTRLTLPKKRPAVPRRRSKFRGVRQRPWGRRPRVRRRRLKLKGPNAVTNFPLSAAGKTEHDTAPPEAAFSGEGFSSPTSVLTYFDGDSTPLYGFRYGEVDAFGFDIDAPFSLTDVNLGVLSQRFGKEDFGEFDPDEFLTWPS